MTRQSNGGRYISTQELAFALQKLGLPVTLEEIKTAVWSRKLPASEFRTGKAPSWDRKRTRKAYSWARNRFRKRCPHLPIRGFEFFDQIFLSKFLVLETISQYLQLFIDGWKILPDHRLLVKPRTRILRWLRSNRILYWTRRTGRKREYLETKYSQRRIKEMLAGGYIEPDGDSYKITEWGRLRALTKRKPQRINRAPDRRVLAKGLPQPGDR